MPFGYTHSWLKEDDEFDRYDKPGSSDWFDLSDDVSFDKPNNRHDALKVESLLGYGGYLDLEKGGGVPLGLGGQQLRDPIKSFQAKNGLKVDGLLRPGGPTITRMKRLYGRAFAGSPAPTPAMMDAQAERLHEGKDGFMHGAAPAPLPRPNKRLDAKTDLFDYERWNRDWARNAHDPASYAQEYESYIRQIEPTHGHDPGLVYARDFAQRVQDLHGNGGAFVKSLLNRLVDRPDLQREFLGGQVPQHPPQGTFRPGGEAGIKQWIDQDRVANGIAPRFTPSGIVQREDAPIVRRPYRPGRPLDPSILMNRTLPMNATGQGVAPDPKNLVEYIRNFGAPGADAPEIGAEERAMTFDDLSDTAKAIASGMGQSRGEPGVQVAMAAPGQFPFEPIREVDVTQFDSRFPERRTPSATQPGTALGTPPSAPGTAAGEGGAGWYDPNQMTPVPKADPADAPPPPAPAPERRPHADKSDTVLDTMRRNAEADASVAHKNWQEAITRYRMKNEEIQRRKRAMLGKAGEDSGKKAAEEAAQHLAERAILQPPPWRGMGNVSLRSLTQAGAAGALVGALASISDGNPELRALEAERDALAERIETYRQIVEDATRQRDELRREQESRRQSRR